MVKGGEKKSSFLMTIDLVRILVSSWSVRYSSIHFPSLLSSYHASLVPSHTHTFVRRLAIYTVKLHVLLDTFSELPSDHVPDPERYDEGRGTVTAPVNVCTVNAERVCTGKR